MNCQLKWSIIKKFALSNRYGFAFREVVEEFPEKNPAYLVAILADMVDQGMLYKLAWNNYHIIPLNENPETYEPDGCQVAKYLMQDREYYIGYAAALKIHGLSGISGDMESTRIHVVTKRQIKPAIRTVAGKTIQFILHDTNRFFGFENKWINNLEKANVSDLERTIVDVATQPHFCGGIVELGQGIYLAEDKTDLDKLFIYFARNMNKAAKRRFLFLTDLLGLQWTAGHERMSNELGSGTSLLDPSAPARRMSREKYGLIINVDPYYLKQQIHGVEEDN